MSMFKVLSSLIFLTVLLSCSVVSAETSFGVRVPTAYIVTTGTGQSDEGIPPDHYETFSYGQELQEVGIDNFNVINYTSVLPP